MILFVAKCLGVMAFQDNLNPNLWNKISRDIQMKEDILKTFPILVLIWLTFIWTESLKVLAQNGLGYVPRFPS